MNLTEKVSSDEALLLSCNDVNESWIVYSDASFHATANVGFLTNIVKGDFGTVFLPDKSARNITRKGNARLLLPSGRTLVLQNVRLVPKLGRNLISVSKLTDDAGYESAKSRLYDICAGNYWNTPLFECCKEEGESYLKLFTFKVTIEIDEPTSTAVECFSEPRQQKKVAAAYAAEGALWSIKSQWYALNAQCVAYKGIVAQERFRNSSGKIEEDRESDAHKIYKGLNGGNDFKHREAYKILMREPRWANLRDNRLNHAVNIPRNAVRRTSAILLWGTRPIGQKLHRKNIASQKVMEGVTASGNDIHALLDELRLEKMQAKEEKERRIEAIQHWQAKIDLEQAKEDRKIIEKDLSTLSGHQLQYYLQRQAEIMERLANRSGPGT
ncbi:hypothetical protein GIB67_016768 [Kingdonia uniflora]|uniref:DRBM domain-containing protein n=1 Tax=Kingdonia uniflora TaxID=39325 RepID=A0A7J7LXM8_9MAGN|nr:hypothetical protein GIB67_016768 [Kingdonia uniflora]